MSSICTQAFLMFIFTCASSQILKSANFKALDSRPARTILPKVLQSLDKLLNYFDKEFKQVNLDAIFGLRISEGVLDSTLESMEENRPRNKKVLIYYLTILRNRITRVIFKSLPYLKVSDEKYFKQVGFVVEKRWTFVKHFKRLNSRGTALENDKEVLTNTGQSYQTCMEALFGSGGPGYKPCNVTHRCWQVMSRPDNVGYSLTHQALYFMLGEQRGCKSVLATKLKQSNFQGGYRRLFERICTSMYNQMIVLEKIKNRTRAQTDLYFEQSVVCGGMLGYTDFLSMDRLVEVLRLQSDKGCYGVSFYLKKYKLQRRTTKLLPDGCESHITGLGAALLSTYLRWLVLTHRD